MGMMAEFHFLRPWWLLALLPLCLLCWAQLHGRFSHSRWEQVCDPALLPYILNRQAGKKTRLPIFLIALCGLLIIIAMAGPVWERLPQPAFRNDSALVIVFDLSRSMDATDLQPSRLVRARYKVADILARRQDGQTALVVFAAEAFAVTPLTDDVETISAQLGALTTNLMPVQGSRPETGLLLAHNLLRQAGLATGDILLITDGINPATTDAVEQMVDSGYRVSVYGIGTAEGAPVAMGDGRFLQDSNGAIVIPSLDTTGLAALASRGQGRYQTIRVDDADLDYLLAAMQQGEGSDSASETNNFLERWQEQGPWLLLLVLPIAALAFRRGLMVIIVFILLPLPEAAQAFDWQDLWQTPNQQAQKALQAGQAEQAASLFEDTDWKAAAQYRAGDFQSAAELLKEADSAIGLYNRGNALARSGDYQAALDSYDRLLEMEPDNEDALYNRKLVEEQLKQKEQQQQDQKQENDQEQQPSEEQDSEQQSQDSQEQQEGEQGEKQQQQGDTDSAEQDTEQQGEEQQAEGSEDPQQQGEESEEQKKAAEQQAKDQSEAEKNELAAESLTDEASEQQKQQMTEQWLRKIPDDPGALLRRKFKYQYGRRERTRAAPEQAW